MIDAVDYALICDQEWLMQWTMHWYVTRNDWCSGLCTDVWPGMIDAVDYALMCDQEWLMQWTMHWCVTRNDWCSGLCTDVWPGMIDAVDYALMCDREWLMQWTMHWCVTGNDWCSGLCTDVWPGMIDAVDYALMWDQEWLIGCAVDWCDHSNSLIVAVWKKNPRDCPFNLTITASYQDLHVGGPWCLSGYQDLHVGGPWCLSGYQDLYVGGSWFLSGYQDLHVGGPWCLSGYQDLHVGGPWCLSGYQDLHAGGPWCLSGLVRTIISRTWNVLYMIWRLWVRTPVGSNFGCVVRLSITISPTWTKTFHIMKLSHICLMTLNLPHKSSYRQVLVPQFPSQHHHMEITYVKCHVKEDHHVKWQPQTKTDPWSTLMKDLLTRYASSMYSWKTYWHAMLALCIHERQAYWHVMPAPCIHERQAHRHVMPALCIHLCTIALFMYMEFFMINCLVYEK